MAIEKNIVIGADLSGLENKLEELIDLLKDSQKAADKTAEAVEDISEKADDIGKSAKKSEKGVSGLSKGFKGMGVAIKAAGIGLLLSALEVLKNLFDNNQKVVDVFNTAFNALQIAFSDFTNWIENNIGGITNFFKNIFENPKENLIAFGNAIKDNLIERFNSFLDTLGYLASAVKKVFSGDFAGALDDVKEAGKEYVDVLTGVDGSAEKIVEGTKKLVEVTTNYAKTTLKAATAMTELNKKAELADAINQGLIEKYDLQAEKLRQVRDDERISIDERIKANEELAEVLDEQEKVMLANAQIRVDKARQDLSLAKDNVEFRKALIEAENELAAVQAQVAGFRSEQLMNEMSLQRELLDIELSKKENANEVEEIRLQAAVDAEENVLKQIALEEELNRKVYESRLKSLEDQKSLYKEGTQAYQDSVNEINVLNAERTAQEAEEGRKRRDLERQVQESKLSLVGDTLSTLNNLAQAFLGDDEKNAKKAFNINKALGISQAVVSTAQAVMAQLAVPQDALTGANFVKAGIAAATGAAQIATIAKQKFSASVGGATTPNIVSPQSSVPPQFNVVGANNAQVIADSLRSNPIKAYVVSSEVTTQQELDRKKINQVSFP